MSTSNFFSASQKGGIIIVAVLAVVILGLLIGLYFVFQNQSIFSTPENMQVTTSQPSDEALQNSPLPSAQVIYQNPFEEQSDYQNPFEESYENPFNNL